MCESETNIKMRLGLCDCTETWPFDECCCTCVAQVEIWSGIGIEDCDKGCCKLIGYACNPIHYEGMGRDRKICQFSEQPHGCCEIYSPRPQAGM